MFGFRLPPNWPSPTQIPLPQPIPMETNDIIKALRERVGEIYSRELKAALKKNEYGYYESPVEEARRTMELVEALAASLNKAQLKEIARQGT